MPNTNDQKLQELYDKIVNDPNADLERIVNDFCDECKTPEEVLRRMDEASMFINKVKAYEWLFHNDKKILFLDSGNASSTGDGNVMVMGTYFIARLYKSYPEGTKIYTLYNLTNVKYNSKATKAMKALKESTLHLDNNAAIYGLTPIQKIIAQAASRKENIYFAKSKEDALAWLDKR